MRTDHFDFDLPRDRIAHHPASPRGSARLLHVTENGTWNRMVSHLPDILQQGDLVVVNDTRVIPAQLTAYRGSTRIGITLDQPELNGDWHVLARNARRIRTGDELTFQNEPELRAIALRGSQGGSVVLRFNLVGEAFRLAIERAGALALPPYIDRPNGPNIQDNSDYQTIFGAHDGAVAAPTAGLHFTPELLDRLAARGVGKVAVTLHVGAGTFLPVRAADLAEHRMHAEWGNVSQAAAEAINRARAAGGRVLSVGTTTLRLLESALGLDGQITPFQGRTSIFIHPGVNVRSADLLLTNFHLPRSTLFMLVCAFAGTERMKAAYSYASASGYRFFSYGDATLLERA